MELHGWVKDVFIASVGLYGVGLLVGGAWNLRRERAVLRNGTRTHATVVGGRSWWPFGLRKNSAGRHVADPVVRFTAQDGTEVETRVSHESSYMVGDSIEIAYAPDDPRYAVAPSARTAFHRFGLVAVGLLFPGIAVAYFVFGMPVTSEVSLAWLIIGLPAALVRLVIALVRRIRRRRAGAES